jgi:hypothetical protein
LGLDLTAGCREIFAFPDCSTLRRRAYGDKVSDLARYGTKQITKDASAPAFKAAREKTIRKGNACAGSRGAGLVPHNQEAVTSKPNVVPHTPTRPKPEEDTLWKSRTKQHYELEA